MSIVWSIIMAGLLCCVIINLVILNNSVGNIMKVILDYIEKEEKN